MRYHEFAITPGQPAINGALGIFVEGCRNSDVRQQLVGLSVLQSAQPDQVRTAIASVETSAHISQSEIEALFVR